MNKVLNEVVIPFLGKGQQDILVSKNHNLLLKFIGCLNDGEISLYKVEIRNKNELVSIENYTMILKECTKKTNILKLFCFLENPTFNNEFFIQGTAQEELKNIGRSISISGHIGREHKEFNLKHRESRPFAFGGITKIDSIEVTGFNFLVDGAFSLKDNDFDFILEMISAAFDANNTKVKYLLLSSILEFIVIAENKKTKISDDSITQRFAQRLSILQERYIFYKREIDKDEEYKYLFHSSEMAYGEIKDLYDIRSYIIHGNSEELSKFLKKKNKNGEVFNLDFYYRRLAFLAKYAIELFITDKQFLSLLTGVER